MDKHVLVKRIFPEVFVWTSLDRKDCSWSGNTDSLRLVKKITDSPRLVKKITDSQRLVKKMSQTRRG